MLPGCKGEAPSQQPQVLQPPPIPEEKRLPVDYVLLLDNSGSIPAGEARNFAREAIKAFIDLTEAADRVSVIAFDTEAQLIASETIQDEGTRGRLKDAIEAGLTFKGRHTDISKGMALLREKSASLFREPGNARPAVILISDGKLEPKGNIQPAYQALMEDWQHLAPQVPFYTLGMGETEIRDFFVQGVNGEILLNRMAGESGGRFYPVRSVDDLVSTCIGIIRVTKGYGEMGVRDVYRTDESTSRLAFLVIKRLPNQQLYSSNDIRLKDPQGRELAIADTAKQGSGSTRVNWRAGAYYDLIVVENPPPGEWELKLASGEKPRLVSLIRNWVHLRYLVPKEYWDPEKKVVMAWLFDERTGALSEMDCRINLAFNERSPSGQEDNPLPTQRTPQRTYLGVLRLKGGEPQAGDYVLEIRADGNNSHLSRTSPPIPVKVKEAYFKFTLPSGSHEKWPLFWKGVRSALEVDSTHKEYPGFREPPKATLFLSRLSEKSEPTPLSSVELPHERAGSREVYQKILEDLDLGRYTCSMVMEGSLRDGKKVRIESPELSFALRRPDWIWPILGLLCAVLFVLLLFLVRPRLKGTLTFEKPPDMARIVLTGHKGARKSFAGDGIRLGAGGEALKELQETSFTVSSRRFKRTVIEVLRGTIHLERMGRPISREEIFRGDRIQFTDGGREYSAEVTAPKRPPRGGRARR